MSDPSRIVAIAQEWIGTPYRHQASLKGVGSDCLGLIRGIWREAYGREPRVVPPYTRDWAEAGGVDTLLLAARELLVEVDTPQAGDVLLFRMRRTAMAKHLGVLTYTPAGMPAFIHAYDRVGVVESPFASCWQRRVAAAFRFPTSETS